MTESPSATAVRFEDTLRLTDEGVQHLLKGVESDQLSVALRNAPPGVTAKFLRCMNDRAALLIHAQTLSKEVTLLPESHIVLRREEIAGQLARLLADGTVSFVLPPEAVDPGRVDQPTVIDRLSAKFDRILQCDARQLRALPFGFDGDHWDWTVALVPVTGEALADFFHRAGIGRREEALLRENLEFIGPVRPEDVRLARCRLALRLSSGGSENEAKPDTTPAATAGKRRRFRRGCFALVAVPLALVGGCMVANLVADNRIAYYRAHPDEFYQKYIHDDRMHWVEDSVTGQEEMDMDRLPKIRLDRPARFAFETVDDMPRMDGATSFYQVFEGAMFALAPEPKAETLAQRLGHHRTSEAYERLLDGEADMIFVLEPSDEHRERAARRGRELRLDPVGREAFVFFVRPDNPVGGLTLEQIRGVYSGEIRNWNRLGGPDLPIKAYQRSRNSGSQTTMLSAVMRGTRMIAPPMNIISSDMTGMLTAVMGPTALVHGYSGASDAIGYSFMNFVAHMAPPQLRGAKLLAIDGVAPSLATVADGTYPLIRDFYAVTTDRSPPSCARVVEWLRSDEGRELIRRAGYTPCFRAAPKGSNAP